MTPALQTGLQASLIITGFFAIFWLVFQAVPWLINQTYRQLGKRATCQTTGRVIGYQYIGNDIHVPIFEYAVNHTVYTVTLNYSISKIRLPFRVPHAAESMDIEAPELVLLNQSGQFVSQRILERFPLGATAPVWYQANHPARAYVLRLPNHARFARLWTWVITLFIVIIWSFAMLMLWAPELFQ